MLAELTRRKFIGLLSAVNLMLRSKSFGAPDAIPINRLPINDLHLSREESQELELYAAPVIEAARALDELDLGNLPVTPIEPALLFEPERFYGVSADGHSTLKSKDDEKR